ncbi:MAG: FMN-binding domain protein [Thermoleophilia bacterium]|nr:FMN-binding domain protein [Thermoleophilia bacterium]
MKHSRSDTGKGFIRRVVLRPAPYVLTATTVGMVMLLGYDPRPRDSDLVIQDDGTAAQPLPQPITSNAAMSRQQRELLKYSPPRFEGPPRTAVGTWEPIRTKHPFGHIQVRATVTAGRITDAQIARLETYDGRSEQIADFSIPTLQLQTLTRGTAKVDHVSGATYTADAYELSLQAAIDKLRDGPPSQSTLPEF